MIFGYFTLLVALVISAVAAYYSIVGLTAIFSAAVTPIIIMGGALEVGKLTAAVWLKMYWERASITYKLYLVPAVAFLMILTSMGIFGFLSKAHSDQSLVSGDSMAKVAIYDEKIKISKDNIDANRKALKQYDEAVDQVMGRSSDEKGADKAVAIRRSQQKERTRLLAEIQTEQNTISKLNEERAPLAAEFRKVESEVGPIKYIAALVYGDNPDSGVLEKAVRLVIIIIVAVFDPLALVLILAAQQSIRWAREEKNSSADDSDAVGNVPTGDVAPTVQSVSVDQQTADEPIDRFAYLKQPFVHFKNLFPIVAPKSEHTIMEDVAAMSIVPPKEVDTRPFTDEELAALDKIDAVLTPTPISEMPEDFREAIRKGLESGELVIQGSVAPIEPTPPSLDTSVLHAYDDERMVSTHDKKILAAGVDNIERPGDYITPPVEEVWAGPMKEVVEEHIDPNTRIKTFNHTWVPDLDAKPDNVLDGTQANSDFGTVFPSNPAKADMYVRVDYLPPRLFKFNGVRWMEVDRSMTDSYYSEEYVKFLIDKINSGEYSVENLSENEQEQIREYLSKV